MILLQSQWKCIAFDLFLVEGFQFPLHIFEAIIISLTSKINIDAFRWYFLYKVYHLSNNFQGLKIQNNFLDNEYKSANDRGLRLCLPSWWWFVKIRMWILLHKIKQIIQDRFWFRASNWRTELQAIYSKVIKIKIHQSTHE